MSKFSSPVNSLILEVKFAWGKNNKIHDKTTLFQNFSRRWHSLTAVIPLSDVSDKVDNFDFMFEKDWAFQTGPSDIGILGKFSKMTS